MLVRIAMSGFSVCASLSVFTALEVTVITGLAETKW